MSGLDEAWEAVEEALPEGWTHIEVSQTGDVCWAKASGPTRLRGYPFRFVMEDGPSPAEALRAVAVRLQDPNHDDPDRSLPAPSNP